MSKKSLYYTYPISPTSGMCCDFHDYHEKSGFCSLGKVKCWAYIIAQLCSAPTIDELKEGHHKPLNTKDEVETVRYKQKLSSLKKPLHSA